MSYARLVLLPVLAVGLSSVAASAETVTTTDGHYYKLVPLSGLPRAPSEVVPVIPQGAVASVPQTSSCRLTNFQNGEYQPEYTTLCGPP